MNKQLEHWTGTAGHEYIERNDFADYKLKQGVTAFKRILKGLKFRSLLEVGSNIGLNLWFITEMFKGKKALYAVEPYDEAFLSMRINPLLALKRIDMCSGYELPHADNSIDIVMTSGVLIHVAPENLKRMTDEIVRVSKKYIICSEYFSDKPEAIPYRGQTDILFKRDFGKFYLENHNLKCINYGFLWSTELPIFDNLTWWVFEKQG